VRNGGIIMSDLTRYGTLLEHDHSGVLVEDVIETSAVKTFDSDEGYQVERIEVLPPFDAGGNLENLTVQIVMDGESVDLMHMHSSNYPAYLRNSKWVSIPFGKRNSNNPIENTCLKGRTKLQVRCTGGQGGVTGDYKIKLVGDYFEGDSAVKQLLGNIFNPSPATLYDTQRDKSVTISRPVTSSIKNLTEMSGGAYKAPKPRVLPYISFAWNAQATTPNEAYNYSVMGGFVDKEWEDFKWAFDDDEALLITHLTVKQVPNSRDLYIEIGSEEHPRKHLDIRLYTNELPFSTFDTQQPPRYYPLLIRGETATLKVRDNGTLIGANTLLCGVWGKKFEL